MAANLLYHMYYLEGDKVRLGGVTRDDLLPDTRLSGLFYQSCKENGTARKWWTIRRIFRTHSLAALPLASIVGFPTDYLVHVVFCQFLLAVYL